MPVALSVEHAWKVSPADFPTQETLEDKLKFVLNYAVLAPSIYNTQPWLFRVKNDSIQVYADGLCSLLILDPQGREMLISCGAAIYQIRLALRYFGYETVVDTFPVTTQSDLLACIYPVAARKTNLAEPEQAARHQTEEQLFEAIQKRRTNRKPFDPTPVAPELVSRLISTAAQEGAWLQPVTDKQTQAAIADLIGEANLKLWSNNEFRQEWEQWVNHGQQVRPDGMPVDSLESDTQVFLDGLNPLFWQTFDLGRALSERQKSSALRAPLLLALGTYKDTRQDWLTAGQALCKVLLQACAMGLQVSYFNEPIQLPTLRDRLAGLLGRSSYPQMLLRVGYAREVSATPRRAVNELILN